MPGVTSAGKVQPVTSAGKIQPVTSAGKVQPVTSAGKVQPLRRRETSALNLNGAVFSAICRACLYVFTSAYVLQEWIGNC